MDSARLSSSSGARGGRRPAHTPRARWRIAIATGVASALFVGAALHSRAAQADGNAALAEALFDEGRRLLDAGKANEACAKFEGSQKLDPGLGTLLFLGECYERAERYASAWARFREASSLAAAAGDPREAVAKDRADKLEPKLFRLTIAVSQPVEGLALSLDGQPIPSASWGVGLPADAGSHTLEARAPGFATWTKTVELPKTPGQDSVSVPPLEPKPEDVQPPTEPVPVPVTPPVPPPAPEEPGKGLLIGGIVVGGLGVVSLAVTGALVGVASSKNGDADEFCDDLVCFDAQGVDLADEARTLGDAATGTFVAGLVLAAAGITMIILQPSAPDAATAALYVGPAAGGGTFGVKGAF